MVDARLMAGSSRGSGAQRACCSKKAVAHAISCRFSYSYIGSYSLLLIFLLDTLIVNLTLTYYSCSYYCYSYYSYSYYSSYSYSYYSYSC